MPLISVIMSVYNGERFLRDAVESILSQTFADFEFIITDDGSTDETPQLLTEYAGEDKRIRIIRQSNIGLTATLNRMIAIANGEFLARMDADDISFSDRFEQQMTKLTNDKNCLAVGCWFQDVDENCKPVAEYVFPDRTEVLKKFLFKGKNCYAHGSVMMRTNVMKELKGYRFRYAQDLDLWLRIGEMGSIGMIEKVLFRRRGHFGNISSKLMSYYPAYKKLMVLLSEERRTMGREISDWKEEEKRIFRDLPVWTEKEVDVYNEFCRARKLLCRGENKEARQILDSIKIDMNTKYGNFTTADLIARLPGTLTAPVLRFRDWFNKFRYYERYPTIK